VTTISFYGWERGPLCLPVFGWMKTEESMEKRAWKRKEQDARRAGVDEGIRVLAGGETRETARVLHGLYTNGNVR